MTPHIQFNTSVFCFHNVLEECANVRICATLRIEFLHGMLKLMLKSFNRNHLLTVNELKQRKRSI